MSEFEGSEGSGIESGSRNRDQLLDPERRSSGENPEQIRKFAGRIQSDLIDDLARNGLPERVANIPVLSQKYGTDRDIACARMAMVYFGEEDPGTDGLFKEAEEAGLPFRMIKDSQGEEGPFADPAHLQSLLRRKYSIQRKIEYRSLDGKATAMVQALKAGNPVQLNIFYHDLHPEDRSEMPRNHSILAKGYRFNMKGELVVVANDPKPEVEGEIEIGKNLLGKALEGSVYVYSRA